MGIRSERHDLTSLSNARRRKKLLREGDASDASDAPVHRTLGLLIILNSGFKNET